MPETEEFGEIMLSTSESWVDLGERTGYEWLGGPYVFLQEDLLSGELSDTHKTENALYIGPYRLEPVQGFEVIQGRHLFERRRDRLWRLRWGLAQFANKVHDRLIQTLIVWRLAWTPVGESPSWRNIFLLKSIYEKAAAAGRAAASSAKSFYSRAIQVAGSSLFMTL